MVFILISVHISIRDGLQHAPAVRTVALLLNPRVQTLLVEVVPAWGLDALHVADLDGVLTDATVLLLAAHLVLVLPGYEDLVQETEPAAVCVLHGEDGQLRQLEQQQERTLKVVRPVEEDVVGASHYLQRHYYLHATYRVNLLQRVALSLPLLGVVPDLW